MLRKHLLPIVSILMSLAAIAISFCRTTPIEIDWISVIVGILTFITSLVVLWQIWNSIQLHNTLTEIKSTTKKEVDDYHHTVGGLFIQINTIHDYLKGNLYEKAIDGFINAIEEANKGSRKDIVEGIISYLYKIKDDKEKRGAYVYLIEGKKEHYLKVLKEVGGLYAENICSFIEGLQDGNTSTK